MSDTKTDRNYNLAVLVAVFACGVLVARWQMMRMPIDNYHERRMTIKGLLEQIQERLNDD